MGTKDQKKLNSDGETELDLGLDLGLGSLLETPAAVLLEPEQELIKNQNQDSQVQEIKIESRSEFESLYGQHKLSELVSFTEKKLDQPELKNLNPDQWIQAQAWWLIAQIDLKSFPVAVLEAPLDAFLDLLQHRPDLLKDAAVFSVIEHAVLTYFKAIVELDDIRSTYSAFTKLNQTLESPKLLAEITAVIQEISKRIDNFDFSEKDLLAQMRLKLRLPRIYQESIAEVPAKTYEKFEKQIRPKSKNKIITSYSIKRAVFVVLCILVFFSLIFFQFNAKHSSVDLLAMLRSKIDNPKLNIQLPQPTLTSEISDLDFMIYQIDKKLETKNQPDPQYPETASQALAANRQELVFEKIKIDTSEPKESEELKKLRTQRPLNNHQEQSIVPGPAQAPHYKDFPSLKMFEVIRPTSLMSKPSTKSEAVAGLKTGDLVQVAAREGYWLRIVSKQGKIAYVLAEDLQPTY